MSRDVRGGILVVLLLTMAMDLGTIHARHHADSLVPVMLSLHRWTPFYWEQDRFGMLVPLLARPFSHPLFNLLVQSGLIMLSTMMGFLFLAMRLARRRFALLFSFSVLLLMLCTRDYHAQIFLPDQPYGSAFGLITGAALAARKGRGTWRGRPSRRSIFWVVVAHACLALAVWTAITSVLPAVLLLLYPAFRLRLRILGRGPRFRRIIPRIYLVEILPVILIALTSLCPTLWLMWTNPYHETSLKKCARRDRSTRHLQTPAREPITRRSPVPHPGPLRGADASSDHQASTSHRSRPRTRPGACDVSVHQLRLLHVSRTFSADMSGTISSILATSPLPFSFSSPARRSFCPNPPDCWCRRRRSRGSTRCSGP